MIIYAICLPLAIILGYLIAGPMDYGSAVFFGTVLFMLVLPLLLKWYHPWLIVLWNTAITCNFLPGLLPGWALMAFLGFGVAVGHYILNRQRRFLEAPSVTWSLIFMAIVVAVTAKLRGGIGLKVLGDEAIGGKRYFLIWLSIAGYFALTSQAIPARRRTLYVTLFLLGAVTQVISEVASALGPAFHFVFMFFPADSGSPFWEHRSINEEYVTRFGGVASASMAVACALLARYGVEGVLNFRKLWRPVVFFLALFMMTLGGFRTFVILIGFLLLMTFWLEGLFRSRLMPMAVLGFLLMGGLVVGFSDRLPLSFQRCIAFLPVKIDPIARMSADASTDWRLEIWNYVLPQVPKYLLLGKGLGLDANDLASYESMGNNQVGGEVGGGFTLAGDYHNGPLSVVIPFGIWGCIAFLWFVWASFKALQANYRYGDPEIRKLNRFLLCYFIAKVFMFFFVFGGFYGDITTFVGIIGLSVSLNGGVAKPAPVPQTRISFSRFRLPSLEGAAPAGN
jgi:hypothetical protein